MSDVVSALVRISQQQSTAADATTVLSALDAVRRAEHERVVQDPGTEKERLVAASYAARDYSLTFAVDSAISAAVTYGRGIDVDEAACVLLAGHALTPDDVRPLLAVLRRVEVGRVQRQLARTWAQLGDLDRALAEADSMGDNRHIAYRDIGDVFGVRGDAAGYFRHWKAYAASKDRRDMRERKDRLVTGVARYGGWRAALDLCEDKRLGPEFRRTALAALPLQDLEEALGSLPDGTVNDEDRLFLLVDAVVTASPTDPDADHPRLPSLLDEIIALDPTSSRDTMRVRNVLLVNLWPAYGDQASIDRAYKAARGPQAKGDLTRTLPRDCRPLG